MIRNSEIDQDTLIYMDYGSNEISFHPGMLDMFNTASGLLMKKGIYLNTRIVPKGDHCEACWERQVPIVLEILMYEDYEGRY